LVPKNRELPKKEVAENIVAEEKVTYSEPIKKSASNQKIRIKSKTSIAGLMEQNKETAEKIVDYNPDEMPKTIFSLEEFEAKWNRFCYEIKENGRDTVYASLTKRKPELLEDFIIKLTLDNKVQEEYINAIKPDLLEFLRKELNNYSIQLISYVDNISVEKMLYTGKEKFDKMAEANPTLKVLQQTLKLIIE